MWLHLALQPLLVRRRTRRRSISIRVSCRRVPHRLQIQRGTISARRRFVNGNSIVVEDHTITLYGGPGLELHRVDGTGRTGGGIG